MTAALRAPFLIGVTGGTASGKTSVCNRLIAKLQAEGQGHRGLLHVAQDAFYRNLTADEARDIASFNFDHPSAFAYEEIYATLHALKSGHSAVVPIYDFVTSSRQEGGTIVGNASVVLFDGILALHYPELRSLFDLKVFVDTDADTRLARRIRRDVMDRGRDVLAVLAQYERTVKPSFEEWILPTRKFADIIVPRGAENTAAIDILFQHIRYQLAERGRPCSPGPDSS